MKFKPGDRIKRIEGKETFLKTGNIYTVANMNPLNDCRVILEGADHDSTDDEDQGFYVDYFKMVTSIDFSYTIY